MAITDKLKTIADAIREKSGKSTLLTLDEMPTEIKALGAEEKLKASEYPDYITPGVMRVVNEVNDKKKDDSIVFIAMSDSHYVGEQDLNFFDDETNASALQANQAAKALAYLLDVDFFAHLGDVSCGTDSTTPDMLKAQIETFTSWFREAKSDLPVFVCIGNHDTGIYYHNVKKEELGDGIIRTLDGDYLFNNFTSYSASDNTVFGGIENGGYCYRDFPEKKLRVFMLNTSEKLVARQIDNTTFGAQRFWLANALTDLNSKTDAAEWGFIILSHYPADFGATMPLSKLLKAYVEGTSFTITDPDDKYSQGDKTKETVNFAKNNAKFIAQFHGHIHNFLTSKLHVSEKQTDETFLVTEYDAWRMCIPNGQVNRENTYKTFNGINFREDKEYPKTANTAEGTSFVVNVITPSEQVIHSFYYGVGVDRAIGYGATPIYSISSTLNNVSISNEAISIEKGKEYSATLTATENNYSINFVKITMGGVDITADAYSNGEIHIESVEGNVIIEATAIFDFKGKNELAISTDTDGNDAYNGVGYKDYSYLSSGGETVGSVVSSSSSIFTSGFIPCKVGETLYFKNCVFKNQQYYDRFASYDSDKNFITDTVWATSDTNFSRDYNVVFGDDGNIESFSIVNNGKAKNAVYIRFCCDNLDSSSIVSKEPIV